MKRILISLFASFLLVGCSSTILRDNFDVFNTSIPKTVNDAVASRVNVENELYEVGSAKVGNAGAMIAQDKANKVAANALKGKIRTAVQNHFKSYMANMDAYSRNLISPALPELTNYATDLSAKKMKQKGAWADTDRVYCLLTVESQEVSSTAEKVLKNFLETTAQRLENLGQGI